MSAKKVNRFYIADLDSEAEDEPVAPTQDVPAAPKPEPHKTRDWNLKASEGAFRSWNPQTRQRKPFFRSYAFRDENDAVRPRRRPYAFRDDEEISSPPRESVKPTTPMPTDDDFPKLSDYERPHTPPYPPDDKPYPTLAERVQQSLEKSMAKPAASNTSDGYVLKMDSVIPERTFFRETLQIT